MKNIQILLIVFWSNITIDQNNAGVGNIKVRSKCLNQKSNILVYTFTRYEARKHKLFNVIFLL